jgi:phosphatidylinositol alpha-1,6-mannosyltransferase
VKTVYHCSEPHLLTTFLIALVTKLAGMNYICFTWQNVAPGKRLRGLKLHLSLILTKVILHLSDGVICGNGKAQEIISSLSRAKTIVAPIAGIDVDKFRPVPGRVQTGNLTILFYGALDYRKGIDILIRAFAEIRGRFDACKLLIVGAGPEKDNLKKLAGSLDLGERIEFRDWVKNEELPEIIRGSSVFVYPSRPAGGWEEQFGYAIAEASACGLPVVATKSGSIDEVVVDGKSGILIRPNDAADLAGALERLLLDTEERRKLGQYGRMHILNNFSHSAVAEKIEDFINGI